MPGISALRARRTRKILFAATPPLELLQMMISRTATTGDEERRQMLFVDVKKAHLNPMCGQDVYFWIPKEANPQKGKCGKLVHWLCGFRPAAQALESLYA